MFYNSFFISIYATWIRIGNGNERLEDYYSLNLAFHINLLCNKMHLSRESISHRKTIRGIRISRLHRLNAETFPCPGRKIRFAIRYRDDRLPDLLHFNGNFSKKGGERSNRHAQIPGRKSFECNPITTPAQSEIMLILVRYGIDIEDEEGAILDVLLKGNVVKREEEARARYGWVTIARRERWRNKQGCDASMIREGRRKKRTIEAKNKKRWQ